MFLYPLDLMTWDNIATNLILFCQDHQMKLLSLPRGERGALDSPPVYSYISTKRHNWCSCPAGFRPGRLTCWTLLVMKTFQFKVFLIFSLHDLIIFIVSGYLLHSLIQISCDVFSRQLGQAIDWFDYNDLATHLNRYVGKCLDHFTFYADDIL